MSSVIAKVNKGHSASSGKSRTKKGKKESVRKQPKIVAAAKKTSKKTVRQLAGSKKPAPKKKVTSRAAKSPQKKAIMQASARSIHSRTPARSRPASKKSPVGKQVPVQLKKVHPPETTAAVRAFEQALKVFNRQEFAAAKAAFEAILSRFGEHSEVAPGIRTYLAVCDQRMARIQSTPRGPEALYDRGVLEYNKGNTTEAINFFERALRTEPRADHIMYSLAAAYARGGNVSKTLDYLRRAIAIKAVHRSHARRDQDFNSLHTNDDFQQLVGLGLDILD